MVPVLEDDTIATKRSSQEAEETSSEEVVPISKELC